MSAYVRRHFPEKLIQCFRVFGELHVAVIIRVFTQPPDIEPQHLVRFGSQSRCGRSFTGAPPSGQIHDKSGVVPAQHQGGETFPSVRRHLPAESGPTVAVDKKQRRVFGFGGNLIADDGVVGAIALSLLDGIGPAAKLFVVIGSFALDGNSPCGKMALCFQRQFFIGKSAGRKQCQHGKECSSFFHDKILSVINSQI